MSAIVSSTIAMLNATYCESAECRESRARVTKAIRKINDKRQNDTCNHMLGFLAEDVIGCPCCGNLRTPESVGI